MEIVEIKLRDAGKVVFHETGGLKVKVGDYVVLEADKGLEYGQIVAEPVEAAEGTVDEALKKIIRIATPEDLAQIEANKKELKRIFEICGQKIQEHQLDMKLVEAEYSFDRSKLVFYFTCAGRVDFRALVKDLAKVFRARIELRQIGVRDEAKLLGGFGPCGQPLCCTKFLKDFEPVTIRMAKEQNLPLNPNKISGICGRLMCCLAFEHKLYKELLERMPRVGQTIPTSRGTGKVTAVNPLQGTITVEVEEGRRIEIRYPEEAGQKPEETRDGKEILRERKAEPGQKREEPRAKREEPRDRKGGPEENRNRPGERHDRRNHSPRR